MITIFVTTVMTMLTGVVAYLNKSVCTLIALAILNLIIQSILLFLRRFIVRSIIHGEGTALLKKEPQYNRRYFISTVLPNISSLFEDTTHPSSKVLAISSISKWCEAVDFILNQLVDGNHFDLKQVTENDPQYRDDKLHEYDIVSISAALAKYGRKTILSQNGLASIAYSSLSSIKRGHIIDQFTEYCKQLEDLPGVRDEMNEQ